MSPQNGPAELPVPRRTRFLLEWEEESAPEEGQPPSTTSPLAAASSRISRVVWSGQEAGI